MTTDVFLQATQDETVYGALRSSSKNVRSTKLLRRRLPAQKCMQIRDLNIIVNSKSSTYVKNSGD